MATKPRPNGHQPRKQHEIRVAAIVDEAAQRERLRVGFQEWLMDRIGELNQILEKLGSDGSPFDTALGSDSEEIYSRLSDTRGEFDAALKLTMPKLVPLFLFDQEF